MPLLHPKKTGRIFPRAPKDSLFSSSANLLVGLLKKKKERFVCGYIRAGSWIFNENRRYIYIYIPGISLSSRTALTTWDFFIWHNFYEGSTSNDQNIRIFPYVGKKRRFVDNTWKRVLGTFENHGYICFRTSLADPVIWAPFPITTCPTLVKFFSFY